MSLQIARTIKRTIMEQGLRELGKLEQDLVFGDAGRKDVIKFLSTNNVNFSVFFFSFLVSDIRRCCAENVQHFQVINQESKLRLMMILAAIYPKKFEGEKGRKMMEV